MKHSKRGWCVACERTADRSEFVLMPKIQSKRDSWIQSLTEGDLEDIEELNIKIETVKEALICKLHFLESDFTNGRVRGGSQPRMAAGRSTNSTTGSVSDIFNTTYNTRPDSASMVTGSGTGTSHNATSSEYDPGSHPTGNSDSDSSLSDNSSSPKNTIDYFDAFIVDKNELLKLLEWCCYCGAKCKMTTYIDGAVLKVNRTCDTCNASIDPWSSSTVLHTRAEGAREKLYQLNLDVATASLVTGNSYKDVMAYMDTLNIPIPTERTFDRHTKDYCKEAVERKYNEQRETVIDYLMQSLNNDEPINVSGDGQFDSVGFSANYCKYALQENRHGFVVAQTIQQKKRGGSSAALEHKGHAQVLKEFEDELKDLSGMNIPIATFTSDRCSKVAEEMRRNFPGISHCFDSWHYFRNIMKELLTKRHQVRFAPVKNWIRHINNQLYWAVESSRGDGQLVQEKIMSTLEHICGNHSNFKNSEHFKFEKFFACDHGPLDDSRDSPAYVDINTKAGRNAIEALKGVLTTAGRLEAATKVSCFFSTSNVEAYNARSLKYHPKRLSLSMMGFLLRSMVAANDWNSKKWEEVSGSRVVVGRKKYYSKTKREMVWRNVKTAPNMSWRREILEIARRIRCDMESAPNHLDDYDDMEQIDEWELDFDDGPQALRDDDGDDMIMRLIEEIEDEEEAASEKL